MANYTVPGVYIDEVSTFPPSVAQVPTAIPAFIGYTQTASSSNGPLKWVPTKIGSLLEYEQYFGVGPALTVNNVIIDANNNFVSASLAITYKMYDSVRLFYANGGGDCYIVSTGLYPLTAQQSDFDAALAAVERESEPTLLVFPDINKNIGTWYNAVLQEALAQCGALQSRFLICDVDLDSNTSNFETEAATFRTDLGINNLNYGAAYTPYLTVGLTQSLTYQNIMGKIYIGSTPVSSLANLTSIASTQASATALELLIGDINTIQGKINNHFTASNVTLPSTGIPSFSNLSDYYSYLKLLINQNVPLATGANDPGTALKNIFHFAYDMAAEIDAFSTGTNALKTTSFITSPLDSTIIPNLATPFASIKAYEADTVALTGGAVITGFASITAPTLANSAWTATVTLSFPGTFPTTGGYAGANAVLALIDPFVSAMVQQYTNILNSAQNLESSNELALASAFPALNTILSGVNATPISLPPSGAVAGIYAFVDSTRGVWKAPANVSVSNVLGVDSTFSNSQLSELNVDVNGGKSINAIRNFTGQGTLVFGARTLAGNDNNYRYVSVRRFLIMLEQSVKNATQQFVFEPNDANTWTKVRCMIENFLFVEWRAGALQGAKPEQAFSVACGLGTTMTAQDILNGLMTVVISVAIVHPAEFIVIQVQQQLAVGGN